MSHATRAEVEAFVARGVASGEFEAHVDGCAACAAMLQRRARRAVESAALRPRLLRPETWLPLAAAVALVVLLAHAASTSRSAEVPAPSPSVAEAPLPLAGVPDAGVPDLPMPPLTVAALDAGDLQRR